MEPLIFSGRVVVVTGAGAGLGRAYALLFGERGASVVVNDLGSSRHGDGTNSKTADIVAEEIKSKGGKAVADYNSVTEGEKIIETALKTFGRIDIVVNNAGILRDKSFARISENDWDLIHDVHLKGSFKTTQAAWPHFRKQNYGRIIMTSSNSGIYGNFGQANYSAAKMGLIGLANTLAIEGRKNNIHCNVIVPTAASRLTEDILPPDLFAELKPELIAPVVVWLCHEQCTDSGTIVEAAAGWATKCYLVRGKGHLLRDRISDLVTPEAVQERWSKVTDMSTITHLESIEEASGSLMTVLEEMRNNELNASVGRTKTDEAEGTYNITSKDCILYALGVGASVGDISNLRYLYENHEDFSTLPTFSIIPGLMTLLSSGIFETVIPGHTVNFSKALHGEQYIEILKPLPTSGNVISHCKVADVLDKGKGAVLVCDVDTYDEAGEKLAYGQITVFVVGAGGFGGKRNSSITKPIVEHPARQPDASVLQKTHCDQAAIYRLSGDVNPLHIDPEFAKVLGYSTPILHGLCSLGFSARHVLSQYASNNPLLCHAIKARFVKPVVPGETLRTDMWQEGNRIHFQTTAVESGNVVISGAYVDLKEVRVSAANPVRGNEEQLLSDAVFDGMKEVVHSNREKVKSINGVFVYVITKGGKVVSKWTLDLKKGQVYKGDPEAGINVDTTLTVDDQDMVDIALGKLNPQAAFMKGKLKIKGNIMLVQKLKILMSLGSKL